MKVSVEDKSIEKIHKSGYGRKIRTSANSMGILRLQVAKHIGIDRMDSFLFQFGWEMGVADGRELLKSDKALEDLVIDGPIEHIASGHISGIDHRCDIEYNEDGSLKTLVGRGEWFDSYEVEQHLHHFGPSEEPVCHTLAGYSSGMMSTIFKKPLIAKEITCAAAGHDTCQWMVRPQEDWGDDVKQNVADLLGRKPIVEELEYTYDNLLEQTEFITNLSDFQKELTNEVVNGRDLKAIVKVAGELVGKPLTIEDLSMETIACAGISDIQKEEMRKEMIETAPEFIVEDKSEYTLSSDKKIYEFEAYNRIVVPVLVQKQLLGYCTMIVDKKNTGEYDEEYLYLEHLASAAALVLLNEKAAFESLGRMKGNYLEQVLSGEYTRSELVKRGKYIDVDFTLPYRLVVINYENDFTTLEEEFGFQEKLLDLSHQYYRSKGQQALTGFNDDKIIMMIFEPDHIDNILDGYVEYIHKYMGNIRFQMGLGGYEENIDNVAKGYEEARIALRLAIRKSRVSYDELGVVGLLINSNNIESIQILAKEELKGLYGAEDEKDHELFETLYYFLSNGGNLRNTAADLALSMSGLRHRIQRIEHILQKDIRDPEVGNSLLLIMKALIVLKDINVR
ncbi:V4R domain-containing protein [Salinicoccus carnicancri]|uniref:V4R domain-containing protein n=1 Tax=Salinicoccus carnicancri TaxID=558170 RepID=UPI000301EC4E|nr:V4R domain-containing protein [Salinicoccus carnicancri]